jgi:hypothetical protein
VFPPDRYRLQEGAKDDSIDPHGCGASSCYR